MPLTNVKVRLEAWREAERRRNALPPGTSEWHEAEVEVASAEKAYRAEFAQAYARYVEEDFQVRNGVWTAQWERHTSVARD